MKLILKAFLIFAAVILSGCGGGGGDGATLTTISGSVVKGPVSGATVTFFNLNADGSKAAQLGTTATDTNGSYTITLSPAPTTPFLAETSGGTYVDEVTGATVVFAATDKLSAALPAGTTRAAITPLTDIAVARVQFLAAGGTPLATAVDSSNIGVASQYGIEDIVTTLPPAANKANSVATATQDEKKYALVLAGIAQQASSLGVRAFDLAKGLVEDAKDGVLDGKNGATAINITNSSGGSIFLPASAGTTDMQTSINAFIASVNNKTNITQVNIPLTAVKIGVNTASTLYPTLTVLHSAATGNAYTATLSAKGGIPPYTCVLKAGSSLPPGFSLVPNTCQITGTSTISTFLANAIFPSVTGPILITLTDSATPSSSVDFSPLYLTVDPPPGAWTGTYSGTQTWVGCILSLPIDHSETVNDRFNMIIQNGVITGNWIIPLSSPSDPATIGGVAGNVITFGQTQIALLHTVGYGFKGTINGSQANGTWTDFGQCLNGNGTWSAHAISQ